MPLLPRIFIIWVLFVFLGPVPLSGTFGSTQPQMMSAGLADRNIQPYVHLVAKKKSRPTKKSQKSASSLIQNLRFHKHADHTRLVVDLKGKLNVKEGKKTKQDEVVLELHDTRLSKRAFRITRKKGFPQAIQIARKWNKPVTITINLKTIDKYKVLTLTKPNRLVLDLFPASLTTPKAKPPVPKVVKKVPAKQRPVAPKVAKKSPAKPKTAQPKVARKALTKPKNLPPVKLVPPAKANEKLLVVIDPGHGGKDPGALGRKGTREKDIVLKVSKLLKSMISERLGAKVLMTREKDVFIQLEDRAKFANTKKADLFVSIHVNSHAKRSVKGLELYHFGKASDPRAMEVAARENGTPLEDNAPAWQFILADKLTDKKIEDSRDLAWIARKALVGQLRKHYKVKDHGVKTAPFFVLRHTTMPGILAEIAFVSNPTEEKLLRSKTYQKRVAEGIYKGIKAYITPLQTAKR